MRREYDLHTDALVTSTGFESHEASDGKGRHHMDKQLVLLDDGEFYIERNCNDDAALANGFLQHRCDTSLTTLGGYECVGSYDRTIHGEWRASIAAPYDEDTDSDSRELGTFESSLDAITVLWKARGDAYGKH